MPAIAWTTPLTGDPISIKLANTIRIPTIEMLQYGPRPIRPWNVKNFAASNPSAVGRGGSYPYTGGGASQSRPAPAPPGSARKPEKAANPVSREFTGGALPAKSPVVAHDGQGEETAAPRQDMVKLKRDLKTLERRNKISEKEAKIYFWLKNDTDDAPRTVEGAAKRSGLDIRKIQIIVAKVNLALRKMEEPVPAVASEGNLHKAGAVRP